MSTTEFTLMKFSEDEREMILEGLDSLLYNGAREFSEDEILKLFHYLNEIWNNLSP